MAKKNKLHTRRPKPGDRRLQDALKQVHGLMTRRRYAEACAQLHTLDREYPQRQGVLRGLVDVAGFLGDAHLYQYACERLHALCPGDRDVPYLLVQAYLKNGWAGLVMAAARRALAQDPIHPNAEATRSVLTELEPLVNEEIRRLGLDGPDGLDCLTLHDRVRSCIAQGRFAEARKVAAELIGRRPRFGPGYNNGADACFHDGDLAEAVALTQRLLNFEPDNVFALGNLVRHLCATGKMDEAQAHAERLKRLPPMPQDLAVKQAEALTWLGDDEGVLAVWADSRRRDARGEPEQEALLSHLAAVAAFRLGREEEARGYWQSALRAVPRFALAQSNLDDLQKPVRERNAAWSYPLEYFVPRKLIGDLLTKLGSAPGKQAEEVQREAKQYLATHPELEGLVPLLLDRSDGGGRELALQLASLFRTPAMLQAVRDFALGKRGADCLRIGAMHLAREAGLLAGDLHKLWLDGASHVGTMQRVEIHSDVVERSHAPGVFDLLSQGVAALRNGDAPRAERALRTALAIDPDDPLVMNNLAVACAQLGRLDEAKSLSVRLYERHPDYLFGRTALANLAVDRGELARAHELLDPLLTRTRLHVGEFSAMCMAFAGLYHAEGKLKEAQHMLAMWREAVPDHPGIKVWEARLRSKTEY